MEKRKSVRDVDSASPFGSATQNAPGAHAHAISARPLEARMFDERPRRSRTFWSALPVLVLSLAVAGCSGGSSSGSSGGATGAVKEIRIGLIFPTTGSMAALGDDQSRGAKLVL